MTWKIWKWKEKHKMRTLGQSVFIDGPENAVVACVDNNGTLKFSADGYVKYSLNESEWIAKKWLKEKENSGYKPRTMIRKK